MAAAVPGEDCKGERMVCEKSMPYRPVKGFTLKEKSVEEMVAEKEKYREMAAAAAKENVR